MNSAIFKFHNRKSWFILLLIINLSFKLVLFISKITQKRK